MYGNRTKHKILGYYIDEMLKAQVKIPPIKILFTTYSKNIKGINENKVGTYLLNMKFEGYFTFYDYPNDHLIEITNKGIEAYMGNYFLKQNNNIFWKYFMNISLTVANIVVAIAAILALTKDNDELPKLKERLLKLEAANTIIKVQANPNNQQTKNGYLPNTKDTLNTSK